MRANGRDRRGQGSAKATMVSTVSAAEGGGSRVHVDTDFTITGRLARFGRGGMVQDISRRLLGEFAACLQEELRAGAGAPPSEAPAESTPAHAAAEAPTGPSGPPAAPPRERDARPRPSARPAKPVSGLALILSVLRDRIRRLLRRSR